MLAVALTLLHAAQVPNQHHPPKDAAGFAHVLDDSKRDEWQKPHEVMQTLGIRKGETIADIGAGTGYFSNRFARHGAKVSAVDIEPELLAKITDPAISKVLALPDDPKLAPASFDTIFLCNVAHHIENRAPYWQKAVAALKPGGRIVVLDFHKKPLPIGPPPAMKIAKSEMIAELAGAGLKPSRDLDFLPNQYFLEFRKP